MAKFKKKLSDHVNNKKRSSAKTAQNPFEVHVNKQKYEILGRKLKNDRGLPGLSRAKAIKKRKGTLLQEYKLQHKSNKFMDRRIGEKSLKLSEEERKIARYTAERIKHHNRKSIFNLADNEVLTHRGQTLNEIEKFDDPRSDDEEYGNNSGKLDDTFVDDAHFGGGILQKTGKEGAKTHKDLIDQLIAESKKRKAEKQKTREETVELTEKLDTEWKDLVPLVNKSKKEDKAELHEKVDDYDKLMRELKFEARGKPTNRLKSDEEIAREEKEVLENLERLRLERMHGFTDTNLVKEHRSADDLDDNFEYESETEITLAYNKMGECNVDLITSMEKAKEICKNDEDTRNDDRNSEDDEDNSSDEEAETEDDLSDLKESETDSDLEESICGKLEESSSKKSSEAATISDTIDKGSPTKTNKSQYENVSEECSKNLKKSKTEPSVMDNIPTENSVSYTKRTSETNEKHGNEIKETSLHFRIDPGVAFKLLLQPMNDLAQESDSLENIKICFSRMDKCILTMYQFAKLNPENAQETLIKILTEKQNEYRKRPKKYPGIEVLMFLKLIGCLFSTSDFRHQLVTPAFVFIGQMLTKCRVKTRYDVAFGLFLVTLFVEYIDLSKRFMSAAIIYLMGMLHMAIPKLGVKLVKIIPPFKPSATLLVLSSKTSKSELIMKSEDFINEELDEDFRQRALHVTLNLIQDLYQHWQYLPSSNEIFRYVLELLEQIPRAKYCKEVKNNMEKLKDTLETGIRNKKMDYIVLATKRPKALRLYEPDIQKVYDCKQHRPMPKEKAEREKLLHKYKREMKGALREIRRDKTFLGRLKIKQQIQSDQERREKVKQIYAEASLQQGELNALDRKKKKK